MNCPKCNVKCKCVDTRTTGKVTIRRYKCNICTLSWYTKENIINYFDGKILASKIKESKGYAGFIS